MAEVCSNSAQPTLLNVEGEDTKARTKNQRSVSTFSQHSSQQDAKVP